MSCFRVRTLFSAYLDGVVTGNEMRSVEEHLGACSSCNAAFRGISQTQRLLAQAGRRKAPADLSFKLRMVVSRETARRRRFTLDYLWFRTTNAARAFVLPALAGLSTAVLIFGIFMGFSALPLRAGNADVPLMLNTAPQLDQSAFATAMNSVDDDSLVIEAYVDSHGRVDDYRILSSSDGEKDLTPQVKNMLIDFMTFTSFRPATSMGRPTAGRAILSFSRVSVKG